MVRTLEAALRPFFTANARNRGEDYLARGLVSKTQSEPGVFSAKVDGTRIYDVRLKLDGMRLAVECSCPYFVGEGEPCKHIWAVVLAADHARALVAPEDVWLDVDSMSPSRSGRVSDDGLASPPPPAWQTLLERVTMPSIATPAHLLPRGELVYAINIAGSTSGGDILIEILTRERKKSGEWGKPKPVTLDRGVISRLPDG